MACPYFLPEQRLEADWPFPQRLPLGAGFSGTCSAPGHQGARPSEEDLKSGCNLGYARHCSRLPADRHADAVRFAFGEERSGVLRVQYTCERDYLPGDCGELLYQSTTGTWLQRHSDDRVQRMAECYLEVRRSRTSIAAAVDATAEPDAAANRKSFAAAE